METEENTLTLREHLEELRKRLIYGAAAVVITTALSFIFVPRIFEVIKSRAPENVEFIYINVTEGISVYFKVALLMGIALALPFLVYQIVMFIRPALYQRERLFIRLALPVVFLFFAAGVVFAYFILVPPAMQFLLDNSFLTDIATPQIRIGNYVSTAAKLIFGMGLAFELPLILYLLAKIGVVTAGGLISKWRIALVGSFVLAAIITPTPDPINQSLVAGPLILLYFTGILFAWVAQRHPVRQHNMVPALGKES